MNHFSKNQEKLVRSLNKKKKRLEHNLCLCEGLRACRELYNFRPEIIKFAVALNSTDIEYFKNIDFCILEKSAFEKISTTVTSQGIIFIVEIPEKPIEDRLTVPFIFVLDRIADPGNFGTILRTCAAVGLKEIWYSKGSVDPYSEKTIRSALSAQFTLNMHEYDSLSTLLAYADDNGYNNIYRTEPINGKSCFEEGKLFDKSIIIFGNEANGVEEITNSIPLNIPMPGGFESLNVAQAVTVILFEAVRRKIL
ncbi:MAG: RNA methyltransferase [bacterium]|nr:RNA methyltransferase [bacterium]